MAKVIDSPVKENREAGVIAVKLTAMVDDADPTAVTEEQTISVIRKYSVFSDSTPEAFQTWLEAEKAQLAADAEEKIALRVAQEAKKAEILNTIYPPPPVVEIDPETGEPIVPPEEPAP